MNIEQIILINDNWHDLNQITHTQFHRADFHFYFHIFFFGFYSSISFIADRILLMQMFCIWPIEIALNHRISTNPMQLLCICMVFPNMCQGDQDKVAKKYVTVKAIFITMEIEQEREKSGCVCMCSVQSKCDCTQ